jgi:hypothetical protein
MRLSPFSCKPHFPFTPVSRSVNVTLLFRSFFISTMSNDSHFVWQDCNIASRGRKIGEWIGKLWEKTVIAAFETRRHLPSGKKEATKNLSQFNYNPGRDNNLELLNRKRNSYPLDRDVCSNFLLKMQLKWDTFETEAKKEQESVRNELKNNYLECCELRCTGVGQNSVGILRWY